MNKLITPLLIISLIMSSASLYFSFQVLKTQDEAMLAINQKLAAMGEENEKFQQRIKELEDSSLPNLGKKAANSLIDTLGNALDTIEKKMDETLEQNKKSTDSSTNSPRRLALVRIHSKCAAQLQ